MAVLLSTVERQCSGSIGSLQLPVVLFAVPVYFADMCVQVCARVCVRACVCLCVYLLPDGL